MARSKVDAYNLILIGLRGSGIEYGNYMVEDLKFQSTMRLDVYIRRKEKDDTVSKYIFNDKILTQVHKTEKVYFYCLSYNGERIVVDSGDTIYDSIYKDPYYYSGYNRNFIHFYLYTPDLYGKIILSESSNLERNELDCFNSLSIIPENYYCFGWISTFNDRIMDMSMHVIREHKPTKSHWDYELRFYLWATKIGTRLYLGNAPEQSKLGIGFSLPWFYYKNIKENETKRLDLLCSIS